ncbi:UDP-N-acetylmuramate dehydrogenase [bacterium]|nr:UDP-N-acetylmuramate dehydrogenase [bacterium]
MSDHRAKQYARLRQVVRGGILIDELLAEHTSFRIGGPADYFIAPRDQEDLARLIDFSAREGMRYLVIGKGTNILFSDEGFRGAVIDLTASFTRISCSAGQITAEAGVGMAALVKYCIERGYAGLEWLAGIPGTVGGGLRMNAGAHGQEMADLLHSCRILDAMGTLEKRDRKDLNFGYRTVDIPTTDTILEAVFALEEGNPREMDRLRLAYLRERKEKQPLSLPSAGSVFKNPAGQAAGRLIDIAGCKGLRIGDALVSKKHANFIVNCGCASSEDVRRLIEEIVARVEKRFGIRLELELHVEG